MRETFHKTISQDTPPQMESIVAARVKVLTPVQDQERLADLRHHLAARSKVRVSGYAARALQAEAGHMTAPDFGRDRSGAHEEA